MSFSQKNIDEIVRDFIHKVAPHLTLKPHVQLRDDYSVEEYLELEYETLNQETNKSVVVKTEVVESKPVPKVDVVEEKKSSSNKCVYETMKRSTKKLEKCSANAKHGNYCTVHYNLVAKKSAPTPNSTPVLQPTPSDQLFQKSTTRMTTVQGNEDFILEEVEEAESKD